MRFALLIAAAFAFPAHADILGIAHGPKGVTVELSDVPCPIKMPDARTRLVVEFLNADRTTRWHGCWLPENGAVRMDWSDGDISLLPIEAFVWARRKDGLQS
jgi:hypothetical protein